MKTTILALIILFTIGIRKQATANDKPLTGQAKIDSLLAELPKAKGDTNEVRLLKGLSFTYSKISPEKGIRYGNMGVQLANKINWDKGLAMCFNSLGANYYAQSKYPQALDHYKKGLKINKEIGGKNEVAGNLVNIGLIYKSQSDFPQALEYYNDALKIYEDLDQKSGVAVTLGNIGNIYKFQSNYPLALEYFQKSLKIYEELDEMSGIARNLGSIGHIYKSQSKYAKALEYYNEVLQIYEKLGTKVGVAITLGNIGNIYALKTDYPKTLEYYQKSLKLYEEIDRKSGIAITLGNMGYIYSSQSNYPKAIEYYNKALELNKEIGSKSGAAYNLKNLGGLHYTLSQDTVISKIKNETNLISLLKDVNLNKSINYFLESIKLRQEIGELNELSKSYEDLAKAYKQKGEMVKAYEALEEHHKFKDSVFNQKNADKIAALEKAREDDLKQKEIEKQKLKIAEQEKREQLILYFSIRFILVMAVVMFIIYRLLKRSDKLLYNVLPVSIAKRLKNKEHPISDYFTQASIVFIDIVNFTEMAKDEDPRRLVDELNKIFTHYDTIANKYGLEKIKTIGDSYMAAAGIPEVQKDNTHRAAQMALEVKQLMSDYKTADGTKIEVRIGLDCGPVVAGVIGENKFIYDMWSDAVNTASRMETSSEAGQVHITDRFKEAVSEYEEFDYVERGEIEIKGKGMMKTYYIENKEVVNV